MAFEVAQKEARKQFYDSMIKQIAPRAYKFKQAVAISSTGAWKNYFYRESTDILAGGTGNATKGIPRGAAFPQASVSWTRINTTIEKYGLEENIPWEDIISNEIDVRNRTLIKITEGVIKAVDDEIYDVLSENDSPTDIQTFTISKATGNDKGWNGASAAIFDDLGHAKRLIGVANYPTTGLLCFISPQGQQDLDNYIYEKGAQAPVLGNQAAVNGNIGRVNGISFVVSNSVPASRALIVVPKRCGTWKQLVALSTATETDSFKADTIRAVEVGVTQLTDPLAVVLIKGTQR